MNDTAPSSRQVGPTERWDSARGRLAEWVQRRREGGDRREDFDFATEVEAALHQGPRPFAHILLFTVAGLFVAFVIWASFAEIDEVTRGQGRVIPSQQMQVVQSLEGGIVAETLVHEGDRVQQGQVLLRIDATNFASRVGELTSQHQQLTGQIARLRTEVAGDDDIAFPQDLVDHAPQVANAERSLFTARRNQLQSQLTILRQQAEQREQELSQLRATEVQQTGSLALARQELGVYAGLSRGIVPQTEVLRARRQVNDLEGQLQTTRAAIPRAESAIREAHQRIEDQYLQFRSEAQAELNQRTAELAVIEETLRAARDRVARTDVRSPVNGVINRVHVTTVGQVVQPGGNLVEIVPIEDSLLIEARIRPSDVAFLHPGQEATVKITAYDFSIYGGLHGVLERISPDTITDQETGESFYRITVRTEQTHLGTDDHPLPIIPGMVASVDILTGHRTILQYLLKPLLRARSEALRER